MSDRLRRFLVHTILALVLAVLFFLPDFIFKLFYEKYFPLNIKLYKEFVGFFVLNFVLLGIPSFRLKYFFYTFFMLLSLSQLLHYSFFHSLIMPYEVTMLFSQSDEMLESLNGVLGYMVIPLGIFIGMMMVGYWLLSRTESLTLRGGRLSLVLMVALLFGGSVAAGMRDRTAVFFPKVESTSIKNLYNVLSLSIAKELPKLFGKSEALPQFAPCCVGKCDVPEVPQTIIVVMGESLNAKYMSLFGFEKETTPKLDGRKSQLLATWGYSGSICTDVSVPSFFMLKREPQNNHVFVKNAPNLFSIAKSQGYTTHYITTQKLTVVGQFLGDSVDTMQSIVDFEKDGGSVYDEVLVDYLAKVDFSKKNFIVLHQRNSHSPYDENTPESFYRFPFKGEKYQTYMQNSYFNAIGYTDYLYDKIIQIAQEQKKSTAVFFTADHGEMMGKEDEGGRFGHNHLGFEDAKVPMIVYLNEKASSLKSILCLDGIISHYQFAKLIAQSMGQEFSNPNENTEYYINGVDITGQEGYITYKNKGEL